MLAAIGLLDHHWDELVLVGIVRISHVPLLWTDMNFKNMPELQWEYGYFTVVGTILITCAALFWRFRRVGWL